jgi:hypothetical protein
LGGEFFLCGFLGQFAFGQAFGGEAQIRLEADRCLALAGSVDIAPVTVALLLLVASHHRVVALGLEQLAEFGLFGSLG